jgi:uncharacterized protein YeaO (DUF488 family)
MESVMVKIKRAYKGSEPADGYRALVDRLWLRGMKKDALRLDLRMPCARTPAEHDDSDEQ